MERNLVEDLPAPRARAGPSRGALVRSVALPTEHGGWSFLLEPIALGLAVAFSWGGLLFALSVVAAFLAHQPLKTAIKDRLAGRRAFRTVWAERFAAGYGAVAAGALAAAALVGGWGFLVPVAAAAPFAAVQLAWDARNRSRALLPEMAGSVALGGVAPAIAVLGGWEPLFASGLWLVLAARSLPSIVYVRARLLLERGKASPRAGALLWHAAALAAVAVAAAAGFVPAVAALGAALLLGRAALGLSRYRLGSRPAVVGIQEIAFGLLVVALAAAGYLSGP